MLKDTDEHRLLQKNLAEQAQLQMLVVRIALLSSHCSKRIVVCELQP